MKFHKLIKTSILLIISVLQSSSVNADDNIQIVKDFLNGERDYKFRIMPDNTPLIPYFPIDELKNDPDIKSVEYIVKYPEDYYNGYYLVTIDNGDSTESKVRILFSIHTSIENTRYEMMEKIIPWIAVVYCNVLDFQSNYEFGDNCWFTIDEWNGDNVITDNEIGSITFLRNNVMVSIRNEMNYQGQSSSILIKIAEKVDKALISCVKVSSMDSLNAPVINSFQVICGSTK